MGAYILRRLGLMIPTLLGIMLISFVVVQFAPGGPIEQVISDLTGNSNNDQLGGSGSDFAGGGNVFRHEKFSVNIPNITPDTSGIGLWTEKMFLQKFKANAEDDYVNRDPGKFNSFMPWSLFGKMKDEDLKAIYEYLKTLRPVQGRVYPWGS